METLVIVEGRDNATPIFVSPPDTLYATVGMETMMSFDINIDDFTNDPAVVSLTVLPAGINIDPVMVTSNDTGECTSVYVILKLTVQLEVLCTYNTHYSNKCYIVNEFNGVVSGAQITSISYCCKMWES